jgi:hypothetical protein
MGLALNMCCLPREKGGYLLNARPMDRLRIQSAAGRDEFGLLI